MLRLCQLGNRKTLLAGGNRLAQGFSGKHQMPKVPTTGIKPDYSDAGPLPRGVGRHLASVNLNPGHKQKGKKIDQGRGTTGPHRMYLGRRPGDRGIYDGKPVFNAPEGFFVRKYKNPPSFLSQDMKESRSDR